jgi:tetratricopeptide (TPR) repeat protein
VTKSRLGVIILIFFLAVAVRAVYLEQVKNEVLFSYPISDSGDYHRAGIKIAAGTITETDRARFFRIPAYHSFLAFIYMTGGPSAYFSSAAQVLVGAFSCCLIYLLGRNVFSDRVGMLSGILAAFYWPFAAFAAKTLPVNFAILFSLLSLLFLYKLYMEDKKAWGFFGGLFLALASLARPNFLILFPVVSIWLLFYSFKKAVFWKRFLCSLGFVVGFVAVIGPVFFADYSSRKEFVPVQKNYAATAYMGSDLALIELRPGSAWRKKMVELLRQDLTTRKERDIYWFNEIRKLAGEDPSGFFKSFLRKIYMLFNYYEFAPYESINYFRNKSAFLSLPLVNFGWIIPFAVLGMLFAGRNFKKEAMPLYIFIFFYFLSLLPFPPLARYRLPVVPLLMIFAAYCMLNFFDAFRLGRWKYLLGCMALFFPLAVFTNTNPGLVYLESFNRPYYHEGRAYLEAGELDKAQADLEKAQQRRPFDADVYEAMGDLFFQRGELEKAETNYKKALQVEEDFPEAMEKLGVVYGKKGELDKAIATFKLIQSSFPVEYASTHINLAACYMLKGDAGAAKSELQKALELEPENLKALYRLTELAEKENDPDAPALRRRLNELLKRYQK